MKPDPDPIEEDARAAFRSIYGFDPWKDGVAGLAPGLQKMHLVFTIAFRRGAAFQREREAEGRDG